MTIPKIKDIMEPLLQELSDGKELNRIQLTEKLGNYFELSKEDITKLQPKKCDTIFRNRVGWAIYYLRKAGLTESRSRGVHNITKKGLKALKTRATIELNYKI